MKTFSISHFYDNIDSHLKDEGVNNDELYWKLLKDLFNTRSSNVPPPT
jgi:hypothetical protein